MTADQNTPTISRCLDDGTLIELLFDPVAGETSFAVGSANGTTEIASRFSLPSGERLVPYSSKNNLIVTGCILLPSHVGPTRTTEALVGDVREFLHRYVDLSPLFEEVAAHYILLTWVYDAFGDLPYLRFRGNYGTGKTRALLTVGSLCYKPFFASGASTVSPIFHIQDAFQGTLILDEADFRFTDQTAELTKVLNNGTTRGLPVLRTMTNRHRELNPTAFRVFGPKVIAMRENFSDAALESRFFTEETGRAVRSDIPVHLPASFHDEARELRNMLLSWRLRERRNVSADPSRLDPTLEPRRKQSALALLSLIDDQDLRDRIQAYLLDEQTAAKRESANADEPRLVSAALAAFEEAKQPFVQVSEIAERFNRGGGQGELALSAKRIGWLLRSRLRLSTSKSNGVYVLMQAERARLATHAVRLGLNDPETAKEVIHSDHAT
jgi:hypothetical protein